MDNECEINAIPAGTEVSLPYAAGTTMVFSPKGIAIDITKHWKIVTSKSIT